MGVLTLKRNWPICAVCIIYLGKLYAIWGGENGANFHQVVLSYTVVNTRIL